MPEPDATYAVYSCNGSGADSPDCIFADILHVGSRPNGEGKWGYADLAGSVWEWNLDWYVNPYPMPCNDCANTTQLTSSSRALRGGSWYEDALSLLASVRNGDNTPTSRFSAVGARCARTR
jgi:formylglycine-generating enzyme required for sulfatase activity